MLNQPTTTADIAMLSSAPLPLPLEIWGRIMVYAAHGSAHEYHRLSTLSSTVFAFTACSVSLRAESLALAFGKADVIDVLMEGRLPSPADQQEEGDAEEEDEDEDDDEDDDSDDESEEGDDVDAVEDAGQHITAPSSSLDLTATLAAPKTRILKLGGMAGGATDVPSTPFIVKPSSSSAAASSPTLLCYSAASCTSCLTRRQRLRRNSSSILSPSFTTDSFAHTGVATTATPPKNGSAILRPDPRLWLSTCTANRVPGPRLLARLVAIGARVSAAALTVATSKGELAWVDAMLSGTAESRVATLAQRDGMPLREACRLGNVVIARRMLEAGANVHVRRDEALRFACHAGKSPIVTLLLDHGADRSIMSNMPLFNAADMGHVEVVRTLLARGVDPNATWGGLATGRNTLRYAVKYENVEMVRLLVAAGADFNHQDAIALKEASRSKCTEIVDILTTAGAQLT
ncbi:hypothetical protein HK101_003217 [Irineochytrium annulatum]|nr:hypothetical protein HK101_003217 [Irineochytrium annulatum]